MWKAWSFETKNFEVRLLIEEQPGYQYDGEDEGGETQAKLDSGEYTAFASHVEVKYRGKVIGSDSLYGSVYVTRDMSDFWTAHRDSNPMHRNCEAYRAKHGQDHVICHYFPGMVRQAISDARSFPVLRQNAIRVSA